MQITISITESVACKKWQQIVFSFKDRRKFPLCNIWTSSTKVTDFASSHVRLQAFDRYFACLVCVVCFDRYRCRICFDYWASRSRFARNCPLPSDPANVIEFQSHERHFKAQSALCKMQKQELGSDALHIVFDFTTVHELTIMCVWGFRTNSDAVDASIRKVKVLGMVVTYRNVNGVLETLYFDVMAQHTKADFRFVTLGLFMLLQHPFFRSKRKVFCWADTGLRSYAII